jgi:UTP--glucose-1-phosphate uridylyltransferase
MLPATKALPKEMLPVAGKPLIQYAIEEIAASGLSTVILVVRDHKSLIQTHFEPDAELGSFLAHRGLAAIADTVNSLKRALTFQYVEQKEPLGLAHAISCARPFLGQEAFAVLLPDVIMAHEDPVTLQLIRAYEQHGGTVIAVREVQRDDLRRHGIVRVEPAASDSTGSSMRITGLVEKPSPDQAPSRFGIFGRYILDPLIWQAIERTHPDPLGEVQLTEALNLLCQTSPLFGVTFQGIHHDAGDRMGYLKATLEFSLSDVNLRQPLLEYLAHLICERKNNSGKQSDRL